MKKLFNVFKKKPMKEFALTVQTCERNENKKLPAKMLVAEWDFSGPNVMRSVFSRLIGITPNDDQIMMIR